MAGHGLAVLTKIYTRDKGICGICNEPCTLDDCNIDHVIPRSLGGRNHQENLRITHERCNHSRGNDLTGRDLKLLDLKMWSDQGKHCSFCNEYLDPWKMKRGLKSYHGTDLCVMHKQCRSLHLQAIDQEHRKQVQEFYSEYTGRSNG